MAYSPTTGGNLPTGPGQAPNLPYTGGPVGVNEKPFNWLRDVQSTDAMAKAFPGGPAAFFNQIEAIYQSHLTPESTLEKIMNGVELGIVGAGIGGIAGPLIGGALGSTAGGAIGGGAVAGASTAELSGQPVGKGALYGAAGGAAGAGVSALGGGPILSGAASGAVRGAATGGARGALIGAGTGAIGGGTNSAVTGATGSNIAGNIAGAVAGTGAGYLANNAFGNSGGTPGYGNNTMPFTAGNVGVAPGAVGNGGADWLTNLLGAYGAYNAANSSSTIANQQNNAYTSAINAGKLSPFQINGPGGMGAGLGFGGSSPTTFGSSLGAYTAPFNMGAGMSGVGGSGAMGAFANQPGGTQGLLERLYGQGGNAYGLGTGVAGMGFGAMNNPLIGQSFGSASDLMNQATMGYGANYNQALQANLAALQQPQQQAMQQMNDALFGRGQLGTTGGALQTQAMAKGFGLADLQAAISAQNQALNVMNTSGGLANNFAGIGNNLFGTGANVTGAGVGMMNNSTGLQGSLANQIYGQNLGLQNNQFNQGMGLFGGGINAGTALNNMNLGNSNLDLSLMGLNQKGLLGSAQLQGMISENGNYNAGRSGWGQLAGNLAGNGFNFGSLGNLAGSLFGNNGGANPYAAYDPSNFGNVNYDISGSNPYVPGTSIYGGGNLGGGTDYFGGNGYTDYTSTVQPVSGGGY